MRKYVSIMVFSWVMVLSFCHNMKIPLLNLRLLVTRRPTWKKGVLTCSSDDGWCGARLEWKTSSPRLVLIIFVVYKQRLEVLVNFILFVYYYYGSPN